MTPIVCAADAADFAAYAADRDHHDRARRWDGLAHLIGVYRQAEARLAADPDDARAVGELAFLLVDLEARAVQAAADARRALDELSVSP